ncbi:hypothetical protein IMG5_116820 [Ichthyophthirius multifiliis]|uniref:Cilia- and flagella-associated protein 251 n=1 Tax=Ichthyophthirius multifiliis TaxID=5932 RepID=G0QUF6_ICHMU|nr:hypothetical protein IMG5_116820 [Ichthyophthirius multifiliis]EGR31152.1 hypothetical protein IMG5_116820 [Ichthyophthirius multifiliis]|eukprot:XP_004034638.1 hypothetical protein IMG5_116820 [Ichthyophthirius multifiliis]
MKVVKKQNAHPKTPILCLNTTKDSTMFASGGMDGKVIIWELGSSEYNYILEKFYEYYINPQNIDRDPAENCIQSVCIGSKYILTGTKSGDIYELIRPHENEIKQFTRGNNSLVKLRSICHDQEIVKSIQFNGTSDNLYSITESGLLCVWQFKKQKEYIQNISIYIKISFNEEILAVALDPNEQKNAQIEIYKLDPSTTKIYEQFKVVNTLSTSLEFIDFSTDNFFLLYKDNFEDVEIIDFKNQDFKKITKDQVEFEMEWCTDGIKVSSNIKGVYTYYSDENKILKIQRLGDKQIAVTDEMGSIRIYNYPCDSSGNGYFNLYTDHLNYINQCVMSPDKNYLVTSSQKDRCILIWKVLNNGEQEEDSQMQNQKESVLNNNNIQNN